MNKKITDYNKFVLENKNISEQFLRVFFKLKRIVYLLKVFLHLRKQFCLFFLDRNDQDETDKSRIKLFMAEGIIFFFNDDQNCLYIYSIPLQSAIFKERRKKYLKYFIIYALRL